MRRLSPLIATGLFLAASCGSNETTPEAEEADLRERAASIQAKFILDHTEAANPETQFYQQFLDPDWYYNKTPWKVGDDCLSETPFTTRDNLRDPGIMSAASQRSDGLLEINPVGLDSSLVFEILPEGLVPAGTLAERSQTLGVLAAYGCMFGPRIVDGENNDIITWPTGEALDQLRYKVPDNTPG
jgi:hypothetical protein